jgi:hypothetical protein
MHSVFFVNDIMKNIFWYLWTLIKNDAPLAHLYALMCEVMRYPLMWSAGNRPRWGFDLIFEILNEEGWGAFYMGRPRVQGRHKFRTHSELGRGMLLDQVTLLSFALSVVVFQPFVFVLSWIRDKRFSLFLVERFTQFSNLHFSFCYAMVYQTLF